VPIFREKVVLSHLPKIQLEDLAKKKLSKMFILSRT
jgi:hypothetical protein